MATSAANPSLSIVIPAYNEAERIRPTLEEYCAFFSASHGDAFEVVVVLNGCVDNTREVVEGVASQYPQVRLLEFTEPLGKGGAIYEGLQEAKGDKLAFVDADNMVRPPETAKLIDALDGYDVAIANRFGAGSQTVGGQSLGRRVSSKLVRLWVRVLLRMPFQDTQCGAKAVRNDAWQAVAPNIHERGWTFDLDMLNTALRQKLSITEVPVAWQHIEEGSKVRALDAGSELLFASFRIRRRK
jgi:dolichyl-phosphate beta-glucosyltransferase